MEHSDDDAPEEISLLQAKEQNLNDRKAERLSKKALADKKRRSTIKMLAEKYQVSEMTMYRIKSGENWSQVK